MNEVTKVHLSRSAFTISVDAKHELQKYLDAIEKHVDGDVLSEIEVRMAELLAERGISADKVVITEDVEFLKQQLGDPKDFADEEVEAVSKQQPRRLMKDSRGQILGGVANGMGTFFGVDPIWFRIAFIALAFASGFGVLLYLVLWMILPEAKTASDFLQLKGDPVTAETIKNFHASAGEALKNVNMRSPLRRFIQILEKIVAVFFVLFAVAILAGASFGSAFVLSSPFKEVFPKTAGEVILFGMMWVAASAFAGLLLVLAMGFWGSKRAIKKSLLVLTVVFILSCSVGFGLSVYTVDSVSARWDQKTRHQVTRFDSATKPEKLVVNGFTGTSRKLNVRFVKTESEVKIEQITYPGMPNQDLAISNENGVLTLEQKSSQRKNCGIICRNFNYYEDVIVYAPQILSISATQDVIVSLDSINVESINLSAAKGATVNINGGRARTVVGDSKENGSLGLIGLTSETSTFTLDEYSHVYAPDAQALYFTMPCAENEGGFIVSMRSLPVKSLTLNGQLMSNEQVSRSECFDIWDSSLYDGSEQGEVSDRSKKY